METSAWLHLILEASCVPNNRETRRRTLKTVNRWTQNVDVFIHRWAAFCSKGGEKEKAGAQTVLAFRSSSFWGFSRVCSQRRADPSSLLRFLSAYWTIKATGACKEQSHQPFTKNFLMPNLYSLSFHHKLLMKYFIKTTPFRCGLYKVELHLLRLHSLLL